MASFEQEEQAISGRRWTNGLLIVAAVAALMGAVATSGLLPTFASLSAPIVGGILAVAGVGALGAAYIKNSGIEKDLVDLQGRKSATQLTQSLKAKGVELTPEQQTAIQQDEYNKTSAEWRERIAEVKEARYID